MNLDYLDRLAGKDLENVLPDDAAQEISYAKLNVLNNTEMRAGWSEWEAYISRYGQAVYWRRKLRI